MDYNPIGTLFSKTESSTYVELARWVGVSTQAIDRWRRNNAVPLRRALEIKRRLNEQGVEVSLCDLNKQFGQAA